MSDDPILEALRRRPPDEPEYREPLRLPGRSEETAEPLTALVPSLGVGRGHPEIRTRMLVGPIVALLLILALGALVLAGGYLNQRPAAAATPTLMPMPTPQPLLTFEPTNQVTCGWSETWARGTTPHGQCDVYGVMPAGFEAVSWALTPNSTPGPQSREIRVWATRRVCPEWRLSDPIAQDVAYRLDAVLVTLAVRAAPEAATICPESLRAGEEPTVYVIRLSEPLGRRALYDAEPDPVKLVQAAP